MKYAVCAELIEERQEILKTIEHFENMAYGERGYSYQLELDKARDHLDRVEEALAGLMEDDEPT